MGLLLLFSSLPAAAQSGPYGNEWIVPGQQYYKIRVTQDGIHRLDNQYLTRAGLSNGTDPRRLQLWRRGQEVAIYVGGNQTSLDPSTFIEFYGQRNDGRLDRGMYKKAGDQPQPLYSLFTDTAAYFLTVAPTATGRRMAEPTAAASAGQPYHLQQRQRIFSNEYSDITEGVLAYMPWASAGEGFLSGQFGRNAVNPIEFEVDSLQNVAISGALRVIVGLVGTSPSEHITQVSVVQPSGTVRLLGTVANYDSFDRVKAQFPLLRSDISADGKVKMRFENTGPNDSRFPRDRSRLAYITVVTPRENRVFSERRSTAFSNDSTLQGPATYVLENVPATLRGYDVTDATAVQRIEGNSTGDTQRSYVFPAAVGRTRNLLLVDAARPRVPLPARLVRFRTITPADYSFLVVSHSSLMRPVGNIPNPVRAYAGYRASASGGRHDTLVVTSQQLYDQFHYGEKSPLAIRQFAQWMLTNNREKYLLLLGKGLATAETVRTGAGVFYHRQVSDRDSPVPDLVPTSTRSPSDIFFTAEWQRNQYVPRIPTGRISAKTPQQVVNYLNKLREHESLGPEPWRKNLLHLAGGADESEFAQFQSYVNGYKERAEKPCFGGTVVKTYTRDTPGDYQRFPITINISPELNAGLSLITYFGHGSPLVFDLNLGDINDPSNNYNNRGKYPVFIVNGCAGGFAYGSFTSIGEDWTLAADKGAIGFLADSDFGYDGQLDAFCDRMYQLLFNDPNWYGKPIAVIQGEVSRRLQAVFGNNPNGVSLLMNTTWQGDPALKLYAPDKPDFATTDPRLQIAPQAPETTVQASSPRFQLRVGVSNAGSLCSGSTSLGISVTRRYPATAARPAEVLRFEVPQPRRDTTYVFELTNTGNVFGENEFTVVLDEGNKIAELSETNNQATIKFNFLQGGVTALSPPEFAIVSNPAVRLIGQNNDPKGQLRFYEMELDTVPTFNSPLVRRTTVQAAVAPEWKPTLPPTAGRDSVVWYWRLRFQTSGPSENQEWAVSSFRLINGSPGGWSQSHHGQFRRDGRTTVDVAAPSGKWDFSDQSISVKLSTRGGSTGAGPTFLTSYGIAPEGTSPYVINCAPSTPNMLAAVFDGLTLKAVRNVPGAYDSCGLKPNMYYHFAREGTADNLNTPARQAQLLALLNNLKPGQYVALVSMNKVNFASFSPELKTALKSLGSQLIDQLQDGDPFVFLGQKGPGARPAQERSFDATSTVARAEQIVTLDAFLRTRAARGTITSTLIGPAKQWGTLFHTVRTEASDSYTLRLIGIDKDGNQRQLNPDVKNRELALAGVSAQEYPYLQLVLQMRDTLNRTAPQLKQWLVTYEGLPEGIVRRDLAEAKEAKVYDAATLAQQAMSRGELTFPVYFQNVSSVAFGQPLIAEITVRDASNNVRTAKIQSLRPLKADSTATFNIRLDVRGLLGPLRGR
ncbi:putative type IX secretion system sortase PorU2 [Hymenobacter radiodurans]|uniref:putative type IX secretion system sortase PorU2 n=1 Tax=Hymenobacter radiodurans TaxID=2496028 RepID=UPI001058D3EC|nr:C25 family cysteine peptidase [Hymenobacter radiodurans]